MQATASRNRGITYSIAAVTAIALTLVAVGLGPSQAQEPHPPWSTAQKIDEIAGNNADLNTAYVDGCPIQSPDGRSLYMASNRPGGKGGLDIWVATRSSTGDPWGPPENLPEPVNSAADDFCPTPLHDGGLLFVSRRVVAGETCGLGDIYFTRRNPAHGWSEPEHLACAPDGPNSALDEQGPSYIQGRLYFSRSTLPPANSGELFFSDKQGGLSFGPAAPIVELNDVAANDIQPNVRKDGREIVFSSNRSGGAGGQDIWSATRPSVNAPWSAPVNIGSSVNTDLDESRPSLSWDAEQLLFGRAGPPGTGEGGTGASDIYVTTREKAGEVPLAFEFRNAETKITLLDFNRNGRMNRGDEAVAVAPLRDDRTGKRVGRAFIECTVMSRVLDPPVGRGVWVCSYVLRLPRGQITLHGRDPAGPGSYVLAVTGGTGRFRDARGQAALEDFRNRTEFVVQLEP